MEEMSHLQHQQKKLKYVEIIWVYRSSYSKQWNTIMRHRRTNEKTFRAHSWKGKQYYRCPFSVN